MTEEISRKLKKELMKRIESCVYFNKEKYCIRPDDLDESIHYEIYFNLPPNDLNKLVSFCKLNNLFIEFWNSKIMVTTEF